MSDQLFQVDLLTEDDLTEVSAQVTPTPEKEKVVVAPVVKKQEAAPTIESTENTPSLEFLTEEEADITEEVDDKEKPGQKKVEPKTTTKKSDTFKPDSEYFKTLAQYHIDNGDWEEPEGWEEGKDTVEWTPEFFADIQKKQFDYKIQKGLAEEKGSYGSQYNQLLEYAKTGAPVENLYSSFQEEQDIESLDHNDIDQAETILANYYESIGWDKSEIKEELDALKDRGEDKFKSIAEKRKGDLVKAIQEDRKGEIEKAKVQKEQNDAYWTNFNTQVREFIHKEDAPEREKKAAEEFFFKQKYESNGRKYTEYDKVSSEIRNNPEKFFQFGKYLMNPEKFAEKTKVEKEVKKNIFSNLRSGQAELGNKKTTESPEFQGASKKSGQYNPFEGFLKR
tara:strand:+ start:7382 stop:8560 length:1179 start_codon:yes stop_codon:yes gene_type:complete